MKFYFIHLPNFFPSHPADFFPNIEQLSFFGIRMEESAEMFVWFFVKFDDVKNNKFTQLGFILNLLFILVE